MHAALRVTDPPEEARAVHRALDSLDAIPHERTLEEVPVDTILAWLAGGRLDRVRRMLREAAPAPHLPLVAARYVAWTGDLRTPATAWQAVREAVDALVRPADESATDDVRTRLTSMTLTELQRTATDVGDAMLAATLHRRARTPPAATASDFVAGAACDPDAATVLAFVHRSLAIEPDATRHRLRLRPLLARGRPRIAAGQIRFGDGSVAFEALWRSARGADHFEMRVSQDSGAVPLTVLLEPIVYGAVSDTHVDGRPAELSRVPAAGGTQVPVQLVLDEERRLALTVGPE